VQPVVNGVTTKVPRPIDQEMAEHGAAGAVARRILSRVGAAELIAISILILAVASTALAQSATTRVEGMNAYNRGDHARAHALLSQAAKAGDAEALVNLGYLYTRGHGVSQNSMEGLRLYRQAAARGSSEGMNALGYRYDHGGDVTRDPDEAVRWYCAALALGNPRALNNLGIMVAFGRGVPVDLPEAVSLWEQAAALGHASAMLNLGVLYLRPTGLGRDMQRAFSWPGTFPAPVDHGLRMMPAPQGVSGHVTLCGAPIA